MVTYQLKYRCPDIQSQEDAEIVREMLVNLPGVGDFDVDWRSKTVSVVTASQDDGKSVYAALLRSDYPPED
jgi:hypothetical protein